MKKPQAQSPGAISDMVAAAMGDTPADTILEQCSLLSVYTGETIPDTQVAIYGDRISYVGPDASHARGPDTRTISLGGRYVSPGFADPHIHIDQFVLPSELAGRSLLCGVTSLFSDPIDVVNVAGRMGFEAFLAMGRGLPIRIFQTVPGGLPVDPGFSRKNAAGGMSIHHNKMIRDNPDVVGMGEVFSWTKVTDRDPRTIKSISDMITAGCVINGHTAGASGRKLNAYVASGIISCHEPIDFEQAVERLRLGMWVMIREGSIRRDLKEIVSSVIASGVSLDRLMFCSDGLDPLELKKYGHIDHCVRESVRLGISPVDAVKMASRNVFDYYGMGRDLGGIAPGRLADIIVFDDAKSFRPNTVMVGGRTVVSQGRLEASALPAAAKRIPAWIKRTVAVAPRLRARDFEIRANTRGSEATANTIVLKTEIVTGLGAAVVRTDPNGAALLNGTESDLWKVAAIERVRRGGPPLRRSMGFLEGLGADIGALASTWSFHENDMIVIGSDDSDMALAANHLVRCGGGVAVSKNGKIIASMPLQVAGIISAESFDVVAEQLSQVNGALADAGCRFAKPVLVPLFLPFLALPSVRMTSSGMIHIRRREIIRPFSA